MSLVGRLAQRSVPGLMKAACILALLALALMCGSVLYPKPLSIITAMSIGHVIGVAALACYLLGVLLDATQRPASPESKRQPS